MKANKLPQMMSLQSPAVGEGSFKLPAFQNKQHHLARGMNSVESFFRGICQRCLCVASALPKRCIVGIVGNHL